MLLLMLKSPPNRPADCRPSYKHGMRTRLALQTVEVNWDAPKNDGGSPVKAYIVRVIGPEGVMEQRVDVSDDLTHRIDVHGLAQGEYKIQASISASPEIILRSKHH